MLVPLVSSSRARQEGRSDGWWINQLLLVPDVPNLKWLMRKSGPCESNGIGGPASGLYLCATSDLSTSVVMRPAKCRLCPQRQWKERCFTHTLTQYESRTPAECLEVISPLPHNLPRSSKTLPSLEKQAQTGGVMGDKTEWRNRWFFFWPVEKQFPARSEPNTKLQKKIN